MLTSMAVEYKASKVLRIHRGTLTNTIHQAFLESRFAVIPQPRYVNIHVNGSIFISRLGLHVTQESVSVLAVRCFASEEMPVHVMPRKGPWTREEFTTWMASRPDLYLDRVMEDLMRQADRWKYRIMLFD